MSIDIVLTFNNIYKGFFRLLGKGSGQSLSQCIEMAAFTFRRITLSDNSNISKGLKACLDFVPWIQRSYNYMFVDGIHCH